MKATPIIMSRPMVIATLQDRKRQTRRLNGLEDVNKFPDAWNHAPLGPLDYMAKPRARGKYGATFRSKPGAIEVDTISICPAACPYGGPGDALWVRETCFSGFDHKNKIVTTYRADLDEAAAREYTGMWRPSIFMTRQMSRLTLELSDVRVERIQDINEEDAISEGVSEAAFRAGLIGDKYIPADRPLDAIWCPKCRGEGVHG